VRGAKCGLIDEERNNEALRYRAPISEGLHVMNYTAPTATTFSNALYSYPITINTARTVLSTESRVSPHETLPPVHRTSKWTEITKFFNTTAYTPHRSLLYKNHKIREQNSLYSLVTLQKEQFPLNFTKPSVFQESTALTVGWLPDEQEWIWKKVALARSGNCTIKKLGRRNLGKTRNSIGQVSGNTSVIKASAAY
jgi:hypothetical protein